MVKKRENPLMKNKLLTAGKKKSELDEFLEEKDEKPIEKTIEVISLDDKIEDKIENIPLTEQKDIPKDVPENVIKVPIVNEIKQTENNKQDKFNNKSDSNNNENNNSASIIIKQKENPIEKNYATFYLKEENLEKISRYSGKGKGKTGYNKSELVDILLEKAFELMKIK